MVRAQTEAARLEELRLTAIEERIEAELELGSAAELVGELEAIVREHPLRERPRGQLMLALYRSGRQAEALQAYQDARRMLVEELGIEPTPALQQLHASILRQESALQPQVVPGAGEDQLGEVVRALLSGRLVHVLGPGPPRRTEKPWPAGSRRPSTLPRSTRRSTRVSQYVAVTQGIGPLYDQLHDLFVEGDEPGPVERFLATLPELARAHGAEHQLLVTTAYGSSLERAFEERGEDVDLVSFVAIGPNRGKFLHRAPDGAETVVAVPNSYAELSLAERPVILKVHGGVDPRPGRDRESFVVSEDDYIGYLAQSDLANVVPVTLAAKLRRSHLLFISYPVVEWSLRVFLHRVFGDEPISYRSWAVSQGRIPSRTNFGAGGASTSTTFRSTTSSAISSDGSPRSCARDSGKPIQGPSPVRGQQSRRAPLLRPRTRERDHRREPPRGAADRPLWAQRRREDVGAECRRRAQAPSAGNQERGRARASRVRRRRLRRLERRADREPARGRADELGAQFGSALLDERPDEALAETLGRWTDALACDLLLILDQAEEYFLYHEAERGFALELPDLVTRPGLRVRALLSIRDDALSKLDRFKGRIPNLFANYLRLDHLDRRAAREAVVRPVERFNELTGESIEVEEELVEAVLDQTATGQVDLGDAGRGLAADEKSTGRIEAAYLQLVLERIWEEEREAGSERLRASTLASLGGAQSIVREHLRRAVQELTSEERDVAADVFRFLVTPSGTKIAHGVEDLADYASVDEQRLLPVLSTLGRERIVRTVDGAGANGARYEIFHDVLGEAVLAWRREQELERERREAERRHRRLAIVAVLALVALAAMTGVAIYALAQRREARDSARKAQARELVARSSDMLNEDPLDSVALAAEGGSPRAKHRVGARAETCTARLPPAQSPARRGRPRERCGL